MAPLVSIIIPCFNAERWLAEAIDSCLAQTHKPIEVIVVDDGSCDNSLAVARRFESKLLKVISQDNQGGCAARNRGLQECQGEFIQYLDADDLLDTSKIGIQIERLRNAGPLSIASCKWGRFFDSLNNATFRDEPVWDSLPLEWLVNAWSSGRMMASHAWLTPRVIIEQSGGWDENLKKNQDGEFFTRVLLRSERIVFCSSARVYYRSGLSGTIAGQRTFQADESLLRSYELCEQHLLQRENSARTRTACAALMQRFVYGIYPDCPTLIERAERRIAMLGGSDLQPEGGAVFQIFAATIGWKAARHLQRLRDKFYPELSWSGKMAQAINLDT